MVSFDVSIPLQEQQKKLRSQPNVSSQAEAYPLWSADIQAQMSDWRVQAVAKTLALIDIPTELVSSPEQKPEAVLVLRIHGKSASWISQMETQWSIAKFEASQWSILVIGTLVNVAWDISQTLDRGLLALWPAVAYLHHQRKNHVTPELWKLFRLAAPHDSQKFPTLGAQKDAVFKQKLDLDSHDPAKSYIQALQDAQKYARDHPLDLDQGQYCILVSRCNQQRCESPFVLPFVGLLDSSDVSWFMTIDPLMQIGTLYELQGLMIGTPLMSDAVDYALSFSQALEAILMQSQPSASQALEQYRKVIRTLNDRQSLVDMPMLILRKM